MAAIRRTMRRTNDNGNTQPKIVSGNIKGRKKNGVTSFPVEGWFIIVNIEPDIPRKTTPKIQRKNAPIITVTITSKASACRAWNFTKRDLSF